MYDIRPVDLSDDGLQAAEHLFRAAFPHSSFRRSISIRTERDDRIYHGAGTDGDDEVENRFEQGRRVLRDGGGSRAS
jgi:hypothetical protein